MLIILKTIPFLLLAISIQSVRSTHLDTVDSQLAPRLPHPDLRGRYIFRRQNSSSVSSTIGRDLPPETTKNPSPISSRSNNAASSSSAARTTAVSTSSPRLTPPAVDSDTSAGGGSPTNTGTTPSPTSPTKSTTATRGSTTTTVTSSSSTMDTEPPDGTDTAINTGTSRSTNTPIHTPTKSSSSSTSTSISTTRTTSTTKPPNVDTTTSIIIPSRTISTTFSTSTSTITTTSLPTTTSPPMVCSKGFFLCDASFGGGCCSSGYRCATRMCLAPLTVEEVPVPTCAENLYLCPSDVGWGCCPIGRKCGRTTCEAIPSTIITQVHSTITPPPVTITVDGGGVTTIAPPPVVTTLWQTLIVTTDTIVITKTGQSTIYIRPTASEVPQLQPLPQEASNATDLSGGAVGGIVGGSIIAFVIVVSAVIFTYKRLGGRGNFELPHVFGAAAFRKKKRRSKGSGGLRYDDDIAATSGSYDPAAISRMSHRQQLVNDVKFGRSASGSSSGGGYRGANVRGSDGFYGGTTIIGSDAHKSMASGTRVTVSSITPPGSPPSGYYEMESNGNPQHVGRQQSIYGDVMMQGNPYAVELGDGNPIQPPQQRWQVTNPDLELDPPVVIDSHRRSMRVNSGTNF